MFDAVIVGAGPAGLNAALTLGRARRDVLVADGGPGRNRYSDTVHNFLSRDGLAQGELRRIALEQLAEYPSAQVRHTPVKQIEGKAGEFQIALANGETHHARRVLLATGLVDELPPIPGMAKRWGISVVHCLYCHGWERSGQPAAVLGLNPEWDVHEAIHLRHISDDVVLCTNALLQLTGEQRALLATHGVAVCEQRLARLEGPGNELADLVFEDGTRLPRTALFCHPKTHQASDLPVQLGCTTLEDESVEVNDFGQTSVPGVFAAGDMARRPAMPIPAAQVVIAAADGVVAAVVIDQELVYGTG